MPLLIQNGLQRKRNRLMGIPLSPYIGEYKEVHRLAVSNRRMTNKEYQRQFKEKWHSKQECLSTYTLSCDKGKFKCLRCGNIRETTFGMGLWKDSCMICGRKRAAKSITYSQLEAQEVLNNFQGNLFTIINGTGTDSDMQVKCNNCGFIHTGKLAVIKKWVYCPKCSMNRSYGELFIQRWFDFNNVEYTKEKAFNNPLTHSQQRMDYYLNDLNICIEIQGDYHFDKTSYQYRNDNWQADQDKKEYLESVGITMLYCTGNQEDMVSGLCNQNDYFKQLETPSLQYIKEHHAPMKEVINQLLVDSCFNGVREKYNIGDKLIKRYIMLAGYQTLDKMLYVNRLKNMGLKDTDGLVQWLRFHTTTEASQYDIKGEALNRYIYHNPKYPFTNHRDLKLKLLTNQEIRNYRTNHNRRETAHHFHIDEEVLRPIFNILE